MTELLTALGEQFEIAVGDVGNYLGIRIIQAFNGTVSIDQTQYAEQLIERYQMRDAKKIKLPVEVGWSHENSQLTQKLNTERSSRR